MSGDQEHVSNLTQALVRLFFHPHPDANPVDDARGVRVIVVGILCFWACLAAALFPPVKWTWTDVGRDAQPTAFVIVERSFEFIAGAPIPARETDGMTFAVDWTFLMGEWFCVLVLGLVALLTWRRAQRDGGSA